MGALQVLDVQSLVGDDDEPGEGAREGGLGQRLHGVLALVQVLALVDELGADFDARLGEALGQVLLVQAEQARDLLEPLGAVGLGLLLARPLLPLLVAPVGHGRRDLEQVHLLRVREEQRVEGLLGVAHLLLVVHAVDGQHALVDEQVLGGVGFQVDFLVDFGEGARAQLVEDVVVSFQFHAVGDSGLFEQVGLDVGAGNAKDVGEVNTNEFTLFKEK